MATGTLLYTPGIKVLIGCTSTGKVLDISDDIEEGNLTLNENNPHNFNVTISNANGKYGGIFMPNDKVVVQMKRVSWLQTFAGYLDTVPYFQVYPGSINLSATCTLKRLKYHYWDPGYQAVINFIAQAYNKGYGQPSGSSPASVKGPNGLEISVPAGDILSTQGLQSATDSGMKSVLMNILTQIIGWDQKKIHVGGVPDAWIQQLQPIWNDLQIAVTNDIMSSSAFGSAAAIGTSTTAAGISVGPGGQWTSADWATAVIQRAGGAPSAQLVGGFLHWMAREEPASNWWNGGSLNPLNIGPGNRYTSLDEAATKTAANLTGGLYDTTILKALKTPGISMQDFALAIEASPWDSHTDPGGYGGSTDPNQILSTTIDPNALAPVSAGAVVLAGSGNYLNEGTSTSNPSTQGGFSPTSSLTSSLLSGTPVTQAAGTGTTTGPAQASGASQAVEYAQAHWNDGGNQNIGSGDDCSAFVSKCWAAGGVSIPPQTNSMYSDSQIVLVPITQILPGDILFAKGEGDPIPPGHVAIYIGNDTVVQHDSAASMSLNKWVTGDQFYGVGRITAGQNPAGTGVAHGLQNPSATDIATGAQGNTGVGNASAGLAGTANGSLIYGSGLWDPAGTPGDPIASVLHGAKALMLDTPIWGYIADIAGASLRNFCSAPNGDFIAWFPDYFGQYGYAATWHLSLIELVDFTVSWSDDNLVTHQYVAGALATDDLSLNPSAGGNISESDYIASYGVATIDMPGLLEALTGINPSDPGIFSNVNQIYQQFGARPQMSQMPTVAAPSLAAFWFAVRLFQENWANQFSANVQITFMPELWPGMLIAIDELQFQCYIHSVTHSWSMQDGGGFSTSVNVMAPSSTGSGTGAASANGTGGLVGLARSGPQVA